MLDPEVGERLGAAEQLEARVVHCHVVQVQLHEPLEPRKVREAAVPLVYGGVVEKVRRGAVQVDEHEVRELVGDEREDLVVFQKAPRGPAVSKGGEDEVSEGGCEGVAAEGAQPVQGDPLGVDCCAELEQPEPLKGGHGGHRVVAEVLEVEDAKLAQAGAALAHCTDRGARHTRQCYELQPLELRERRQRRQVIVAQARYLMVV
mmetsp:Transcript_4271/g.14806  ORF Transcript_4271/g.14806 Transcript_4271/m.14806 type:complete len:204 (-) Transcript_4271:58-669(-)